MTRHPHKPFIVAYVVWFCAALLGKIVISLATRSLASLTGSTIIFRLALWIGWFAMLAISYLAFRYVIVQLIFPFFVGTDYTRAEHPPGTYFRKSNTTS